MMARFYDIHAKAIQRAASVNRLSVGECFRIIMWEPLGPVLNHAPENDTATIITFQCRPEGRFEPATPADRQAIADWSNRHRSTPDSAWELPDFGGGPQLSDMMPSDVDRRTEQIVKRALNQIGNALKDHGLFVTVDTDGNYGVERLPADFPIKDERVSDHLRRVIHDRIAQGRPPTGLRISDKEARKLAAELAELQFNQPITEAEIYAGLVDGKSRFLDLPVSVYWS